MKKPTKTLMIKKLDKLFSEVVRSIGYCERCHSKDKQLQCAHIYSRRYKHTRWSTLNAVAFCAGCHFWAHQNPIDFTKWVEDYLGVGTITELREESHRIDPVTLQTMISWYDELLKVKTGA